MGLLGVRWTILRAKARCLDRALGESFLTYGKRLEYLPPQPLILAAVAKSIPVQPRASIRGSHPHGALDLRAVGENSLGLAKGFSNGGLLPEFLIEGA